MSKHRKHHRNLKPIVPVLLILLLSGLLFYEIRIAQDRQQEYRHRAAQSTRTAERATANWQGKTYYLRTDLECYALLGIDSLEPVAQAGTNPSQCDFAAVAVLDKKNERWHLLMLNRDTMCNVPMLSAQGKTLGSRHQQLALAHTYGSGSGDSCRNTVQAIENLLYGISLDGYIRISVGSIGRLNDAVGGVTVTLRDDLSALDEAMVPEATLTLDAEQAEHFVRARSGLEDSTNLNRMERQRDYLTGWLEAAGAYADENGGLSTLVEQLSGELYSDMSIYRISSLADAAIRYPFPEIRSPGGTIRKGTQFIEFEADENELQQTVIDLFYTLEKE